MIPQRGLFLDLMGAEERRAEVNTISALFPLIVEGLDRAHRRAAWSMTTCSTPPSMPCPTPYPRSPPTSPALTPTIRMASSGAAPTWVNSNWFLAHALHAHGYPAQAARIAQATRAMVDSAGLPRVLQPLYGRGPERPRLRLDHAGG